MAAWGLGAVLGAVLIAVLAAAQAAEPTVPLHLRVVGGLGGVNQYTRQEEPFWTQRLPQLSQGRVTAEIVPFDQAGFRGEEMLRLVQSGSVPFGTLLLVRAAAVDPELGAIDLPGLNPDMAALRRHLAAYRPHLEALLRERHGIEPLAIYVYPSQVTFCARAFSGFNDLAGRRVRVAGVAQADLLRALGAKPVQTEFAQVVAAVRTGIVDCAVTGSMSGLNIGLDEVTTHVDPRALSWGVSVFGAHAGTWKALPADVQQLLRRGLAELEQSVWTAAESQSAEGIECVTGAAGCRQPRRGHMQLVPTDAAGGRRLREAFVATVLPAWIQRCGSSCVAAWNRYLAPAVGVQAAPR